MSTAGASADVPPPVDELMPTQMPENMWFTEEEWHEAERKARLAQEQPSSDLGSIVLVACSVVAGVVFVRWGFHKTTEQLALVELQKAQYIVAPYAFYTMCWPILSSQGVILRRLGGEFGPDDNNTQIVPTSMRDVAMIIPLVGVRTRAVCNFEIRKVGKTSWRMVSLTVDFREGRFDLSHLLPKTLVDSNEMVKVHEDAMKQQEEEQKRHDERMRRIRSGLPPDPAQFAKGADESAVKGASA